ncbi:two-component system, chemotaxis family, sensor kinase CheA (plasmid) [Deferribacter desulfuricans SSM1]|uniref:histidine kinase n=1 Tax=Deferribacter desulfuricans (strain DSM 14783 / JCM 11476 / NBRC 101012 / SSM1) TaxID=639282 RepID=D3PF14_DEFDS|nr:chemotaxis protein CheW [Deferribacter desulfuricans]BAI81806.1 two-component system, chemotaxis family, sensor kinase CheA [Deferribacter desulfuricans SSM1]
MSNEQSELIQDFLIETDELIEQLDQDLIELEQRKNDFDLLNKIFRAVHTVKGSSSFLGLDKVVDLTHIAEEILNKLRKGEITITSDIMDALLESIDYLKKLINDIKQGTDTTNITDIVKKLNLINEGKIINNDKNISQSTYEQSMQKNINKNEPKQIAKVTKAIEQTIRVDVNRLDALMNLIGELVLSRNRITQISTEFEKKYEGDFLIEQLLETTSHLGLITTELQLAIMKTRMVPIGKVFNKFPRMVRDLCKELNKDIDLIINGEDTELDKSVVEEIGDPLIHMIRNAVDHGIETPEERIKKGKPKKGTVTLNAYHEGNHIVIEIKDDGRGLDPEKIKKKAIEKGIITPEEIKTLSKEEIFGLIFKPGFSTAEKVTDVSGRGVGMDVVKTNIEKLNGIIQIDSEIDIGTTFKLKLPLTLAIIQSLLVEVSGEIFAIPIISIIETVKIEENQIHSFEGREVLKLRDSVLSLIRLNEIFELEPTYSNEMYVVVVALAEKKIGLIVDRLIGQEEIVIKSLGEYLGGTPGISGATIMGDGTVKLILDIAGTIDIASKMPKINHKKNKYTNKITTNYFQNLNQSQNLNIMIIDDSATDRKIMKRLLNNIGSFNIIEITNGKDALAAAKQFQFDLIITDIYMPDMDGFEIAKKLRELGYNNSIVATSVRDEAKNNKNYSLYGIDAFISKPINTSELLNIIENLKKVAV